jgi:hypothetical protein
MRKKRSIGESRALLLFVALGISLPQALSARTVRGVDLDVVPWETFCPAVESVALHTGSGDCPTVHPASAEHARWNDLGTGVKERKPNCARLEREYRQLTTPKVIGGEASWAACTMAFSRALNMRAMQPERFSESLAEWRERYFGRWLSGTAR